MEGMLIFQSKPNSSRQQQKKNNFRTEVNRKIEQKQKQEHICLQIEKHKY